VPAALAGMRIDRALAQIFPQYSRSRLQAWMQAGHVKVRRGGAEIPVERSTQVAGDERVEIAPPQAVDASAPPAQRLPLAIVFEDRDLIVLDKPAGLVVHPGAGNPDRTLMNALLAHAPALRQVPRAGIVHRLDKDTSGLMVVAKNLSAQANLAAQLADRSVARTYLALVHGAPPERGLVDAPIGRDTRARTRMTVTRRGKEARTRYRVLERFGNAALVECKLETGRTHQIRVHLTHLGYPLAGDDKYGDFPWNKDLARQGLKRMFLHAHRIGFVHPLTGVDVVIEAPLPADLAAFVTRLGAPRAIDSDAAR
jgi:23S rRNA pseudouridine1911/1915/1917 synthase